MSWLNKLFTKQSKVGALISSAILGRAAFPKRNFVTFAKEAYQLNIIAYRCIELIATGAASVPWSLHDESTDKEVDDPQHPLLKLLRRPNPTQSGKEMFTSAYAYDLLTGNSYLERVMVGNAKLQELWSLRPDRIKILPGKFGVPSGYEYAVGNVAPVRFEADPITGMSDILHVKRFNPLDDWYGQSPLEAIGMSVDSHNESTKWNYALLQNGARPSGTLMSEGEMDDVEFKRLKEQLEEGYSKGRQGKPMVLSGGLTWVQMMLSQVEMDWLEGKERAASEIAIGYKVPEQLVGVKGQQTYNNYREARMALYEDAVLPLLERYSECLTYWIQSIAGYENLCLRYDEDKIPALYPRRELIWDKVNAAKFITIDEKREALGYEKYDVTDTSPGNMLFISASELPLAGSGVDTTDGGPAVAADPSNPGFDVNGDPLGSLESVLTGTRSAPVQDLALNGAQIAAVVQIVQAVADKQLPPESAIQLLLVSFPSIDEAAAHMMVDPAVKFEPKPPEPPPGAMLPGAKPGAKPTAPKTVPQKLVLNALLELKKRKSIVVQRKAYRLAYGGGGDDRSVHVNVNTPDIHMHPQAVNVDARTSIDAGAIEVNTPIDVKSGDSHFTLESEGDSVTEYTRDPLTKELVESKKTKVKETK